MRNFLIGTWVLALAAIGLRLWVSAHEWFINDDFYFLHFIRSPDWSWHEVFLPSHARPIGAYRPIGLEGYYVFNFLLFGLHAFGYYVVGLLVHIAMAGATYRIARQLELEPRAALTSALLVLAAAPGTLATYSVSVHNYLLAGLFFALCVSFAIDALRRDSRAFQVASCAALLLGLLSNDVCVTAPAVVLAVVVHERGFSLQRERLWATLKAALPQIILVVLFLDFRLNGVPLRQDGWFYEIDFGPDMLSNTAGNLREVAGGRVQLGIALGMAALGFVWAARRAPDRGRALLARAARSWLVCGVWLAAVLFPFAVLPLPHPRFALVLETPAMLVLCTALAAWLPSFSGTAPALRGGASSGTAPALRGGASSGTAPALRGGASMPNARMANACLLGLVALLIPWQPAFERARHPEGAVHRENFAMLEHELQRAQRPPEHVEIAYGAKGLADDAALDRFQWETFRGAIVLAAWPKTRATIDFRDLRKTALERCESCATYDLEQDLHLRARRAGAKPASRATP